jgi:glycosyltransferase involved in cell wall biosynthesis
MDAYARRAPVALRILVLTRSYPAANDLYQYPFVHRRVLAYRAAGHEVAVFRPKPGEPEIHEFDSVDCRSGGPSSLAQLASDFRPHVIAAHGLSETMWPTVAELDGIPMCAWLHGSEIPAFFRQKGAACEMVEARAVFWRNLLHREGRDLKLVFPSRSAVALMSEDCELRDSDYTVLPNPIDTNLFAYSPKLPEDRFSILSIRPYDSPTYANDLAVAAVRHLSSRANFERMRFTFIGDGPLLQRTLAPIAGFSNVTICRGFLTQAKIAREHARHGIFLVPTRLDTHGVSRDEAMASGLVPVTNALEVVREFVDEGCAGLATPEDAGALGDEIARMIDEPALFLRRSAAAAERVHRERGHGAIIPAELAMLAAAIHA